MMEIKCGEYAYCEFCDDLDDKIKMIFGIMEGSICDDPTFYIRGVSTKPNYSLENNVYNRSIEIHQKNVKIIKCLDQMDEKDCKSVVELLLGLEWLTDIPGPAYCKHMLITCQVREGQTNYDQELLQDLTSLPPVKLGFILSKMVSLLTDKNKESLRRMLIDQEIREKSR